MVCSPDDLRACFVEDLPERTGPAYLGFDFGEATSSTAAAAIWPATNRLETWMAFGDNPPVGERGKRDDAPYPDMHRRGELRLYPGRVVHPDVLLSDVQADLAGCRVRAAAADSYKDSEVRDFLDRAAVRWPIDFRRVGAGKVGDDVVAASETAGIVARPLIDYEDPETKFTDTAAARVVESARVKAILIGSTDSRAGWDDARIDYDGETRAAPAPVRRRRIWL